MGMGSANERQHYNVTSSLIGWVHTQNDPYFQDPLHWCCMSVLLSQISSNSAVCLTVVHADNSKAPNFSDQFGVSQVARFVGPTWGPPGSCRPQMGPMLTPWTLLSGILLSKWNVGYLQEQGWPRDPCWVQLSCLKLQLLYWHQSLSCFECIQKMYSLQGNFWKEGHLKMK